MSGLATLDRPVDAPVNIGRLRGFVTAFADLLAATRDEQAILESGRSLLARLIAADDWLPEEFTRPNPDRYQQYLLHCDSRERFSVVSFVWGPGQATPIHDHSVWGLVGVLRGVEKVERFRRLPTGGLVSAGEELLREGEVDAVSPRVGDIHRVTNGLTDRPSISIHVYGANIGAVERATYATDGTPKSFISGYANGVIPNLWDRSKSV
ncbi:cysteine dioxygenase [Sphingobium sp.]|uniref:cysteine dioxygenase family protein n=1 Tax=Sphingobium sp. TaxID=1912891 RepID=UPI0026140192|nr:cysteine dioxygenase [Sphingobium sp.]